ncbi:MULTISPECIES: DUF3306 domain-containing protein [Ramlibacter]|uniref:DUF3306 domain-containing protein n=1 Tax=Ramlibacter pinisoli TaxID=2682844 RepID=A0A6N8IRZ2_9BURK|nr:DUF3306 domain-containing protein [Ramlibacter sp. CGMCC 1.13660]MVQ29679.1 DUF3306 domain-containing protein [Ramlibacter pinisoli]
MADGFLGRWSRRKLDAKDGKPLDEPAVVAPPAAVAPVLPAVQPDVDPDGVALAAGQQAPVAPPAAEPEPPPPTLEDVQALTPESDFRRFVGRDVAPDVKNAAVKKLFADPRYNIQDGLDVYIDDYSKPDPIPESMLRSLASAKFLGLFREEEREDAAPGGATREGAEELPADSVAQSGAADPTPLIAPTAPLADHADPDLRLQQDHAAPGEEPGHGTG